MWKSEKWPCISKALCRAPAFVGLVDVFHLRAKASSGCMRQEYTVPDYAQKEQLRKAERTSVEIE